MDANWNRYSKVKSFDKPQKSGECSAVELIEIPKADWMAWILWKKKNQPKSQMEKLFYLDRV